MQELESANDSLIYIAHKILFGRPGYFASLKSYCCFKFYGISTVNMFSVNIVSKLGNHCHTLKYNILGSMKTLDSK
jgi:hypothetical protein